MASTEHGEGAEHREHTVSPAVYAGVLGLLMLLLIVTVAMAFIDVDRFTAQHHLGTGWNTVIALSIASVKAILIVLFFMHIRYGTRLTWPFAAAGFVWLGIMLTLTMTDYLSRNHPPGINPKGEPKFILPTNADPPR
jgi:cytochrome c oxidase subunit 4